MHCPRCGQQQASEDIKFCSRCGFPLSLVSQLLTYGGYLPQLADLNNKDKKWLTRNFGLKIALIWFLLIDFILVPLAAITKAPGEFIPALAVIGFCGALLIAALSVLFLPKEVKYPSMPNEFPNQPAAPQYLGGNQNQNALPPPTSQPAASYMPPVAGSWQAPETGEIVPRSVTEGTTKLLQKDE
jgi:hypothetical protein